MIPILPLVWNNWLGDLTVGCARAQPSTQSELIDVVKFAVRNGRRIRAVGSGHSYSSAARPRDIFVDLSAIYGPFDQIQWLKPNPPGLAAGEELVRVRAGTMLKRLNRIGLAERNRPLAGC